MNSLWSRANNVTIRARWSRRSEGFIPQVDWLGKAHIKFTSDVNFKDWRPVLQAPPPGGSRSTSEWSLRNLDYEDLCDWAFGEGIRPQVDLFASAANKKCGKYFSWWWDPEAAGEAFSESWDGLSAYGFPPFSQVGRVINKLTETSGGSQILLILPHNRADPLYPRLLEWEESPLVKSKFLDWSPGIIHPDGGDQPMFPPPTRLKAWFVDFSSR